MKTPRLARFALLGLVMPLVGGAATLCKYSRVSEQHGAGRCANGTPTTYCHNVVTCEDGDLKQSIEAWATCKAVADGTKCPSATKCYQESAKVAQEVTPQPPLPPPPGSPPPPPSPPASFFGGGNGGGGR